ncbi:putative ribonuclease H-like domain-containing protein [Tanacetum coccineum]
MTTWVKFAWKKSDEGFLVGYSLQSKAFRVYNLETKRVEENLHITFLENKPNVAGKGPTWLFDLDYLTDSMNYHPVSSENQANLHAGQKEANQNAGTEEIIDAGDSEKEDESAQDCFVLPIWPSYSSTITPDDKREGPRKEEQVFMDDLKRLKRQEKEANEEAEALRKKFEHLVIKEGAARPSSTNIFSTVSTPAKASSTNLVNTVSIPVSTASHHDGLSLSDLTNPEEDDSEIPPLEDIYQNSTDGIFTTLSYDDEGAVSDFTNLETVVNVSPIPTSRIHSTHPKALILGDPTSAVQTRSQLASCLNMNPRRDSEALEELKAVLMLCRRIKVTIGGIKAQYGLHQAPRAWYTTLSTFLLKNGYRRGTIVKNLFLKKDKHDIILVQVYVDDSSLASTKKSWCDWIEALMKSRFQRSSMGELTFLYWDYKSMIGSLMYLAASRPDIMFAVCACSRVSSFGGPGILYSVVTMLEQILTGNPQQEVVNFLAGDSFLGNAKSRPLWLLLLQKQNMLLLQAAVGKFCGFKSNVSTMVVLDSCPKHNMVAYLEKSEGNAKFHEILIFLAKSISALTHITAKSSWQVCVYLLMTSIRSDLLFDDAGWDDSLPDQAIFDVYQLMGRAVPLEQQSGPIIIPKTFTHLLLFHVPNSQKLMVGILESFIKVIKSLSGNEGEMTLQSVYDLCLSLCAQVTDQAKEIQHLKAQIKKLKKQAKPVIHQHRAWLKSVSLKQRLTRKSFPKKQRTHKESVSKQGRKFAKGESSVQRDPLFDELPEDTVDHMETENAQDEGRTRDIVDGDKEIEENVLSTEDVLSTDKDKVSTDMEKVSTDRPIVSTDGSKVSTDRQIEGTDEHIEGTDEQVGGTEEHNEGTDEQVEHTEEHNEGTEKHIEGTDEHIESTDGQRKGTEDQFEEGSATQATQTPTSTIFGDDETIAKVLLNMSQAKAVSREKEKGVELKDIEETDRPRPTSTRSLLTLKPLPKIDPKDKGKKKIEEEDESESESDALIRNFDDIKARIEADRLLAEKLQEQEREQIYNRRKSKEYFKHAELKIKKFEEGTSFDEKIRGQMKIFLYWVCCMKSKKEDIFQNTSEDDSDKENDELRLHLTIAPDKEKEVDYEILDRKYPIKEWKTECLRTKPQTDQGLNTLKRINLTGEALNAEYHLHDENKFWNAQQDWNIKKYPLRKEVLMQMLKLKLESEEDNTMALELIRFIKKILAELEPEE